MDLELWDEKHTVSANGFMNTGVICYFNSLLQGFLSCTSMTKLLGGLSDKELSETNSLVKLYNGFLKELNQEGKRPDAWSPIIWNEFKMQLDKISKGKGFRFGAGQEDSHEAMTLFLQGFEMRKLDKLFEHRYLSVIYCDLCRNICSKKVDEGFAIEIHGKELKSQGLASYISKHSPPIDDDYRCPHCGQKGHKRQQRILTMLPEIIILQFKKYDDKWSAEFPLELDFPRPDNKAVKYKLVSQTEHVGSTAGGHYWARGLRKDGKVWMLNDTSMAESKFEPSPATYLAWYHVSGIVSKA